MNVFLYHSYDCNIYFLKNPPVDPIYFFSSFFDVIVASYITFSVRHLSSNGHVAFTRQLHGVAFFFYCYRCLDFFYYAFVLKILCCSCNCETAYNYSYLLFFLVRCSFVMCFSISCRKLFHRLVLTDKQKGGL